MDNTVEINAEGASAPHGALTAQPDDASLDTAGKPLHGSLKQRTIHRGNAFAYWPSQLRPSGENLRIWTLPRNRAKVLEFAQTIFDGGIRVPVSVFYDGDDILIEHGETRWLAAMLLEGTDVRNVLDGVSDPKMLALLGAKPKNSVEIPAVRSPKVDEVERLRDLVVHNSGQNFSDLELAKAIKKWTVLGKTQVQIAELLGGEANGWTQTRVSHVFQLYDAPEVLRELVAAEVITTTTAVNAMRLHKDGAVAAVLSAIEDVKGAAWSEQAAAEAEAIDAQRELQRIVRDGDEGKIAPAPGKRPIPKLEHATRRVTAAADRIEQAKLVQQHGPARLTSKEIDLAVKRRRPDTKITPALSRAAISGLIDGIKFEAQYTISAVTHERMNNLLKQCGFPLVERRVDDEGNALPLPGESTAA